MRKTLLIAALVLLPACGTDQRILAGHDLRDSAVAAYSTNMDAIFEAMVTAYQTQGYNAADAYYAADLKKLASSNADAEGKVDAAKAVAFLLEAEKIRKDNKAKVDEQVNGIRKAYKEACLDLAISTELSSLLRQYSAAGVDMTAAEKAIDEILTLLKR